MSSANSQSGFPSQTWESSRLRLLFRCIKFEPTQPGLRLLPAGNQCKCHWGRRIRDREPLSCWGLLRLIAPLGKKEQLARNYSHFLESKTVSIAQSSLSSLWGQSRIPSQSCLGLKHSQGAKPQEKRPWHEGNWVEPMGKKCPVR